MDAFFYWVFAITGLFVCFDWLLTKEKRKQLNKNVSDWFLYTDDISSQKFSATIKRAIERAFGTNWLSGRFIFMAIALSVIVSFFVIVLTASFVEIGTIEAFFSLIVIPISLVGSAKLYLAFGFLLVSIATWLSLVFTLRTLRTLVRNNSIQYFFLTVVTAITLTMIGGISLLEIIWYVSYWDITYFLLPVVITTCLASLLYIIAGLLVSSIFISAKLVFKILKPLVTSLLMRLHESKQGVISLMALIMGMIAKLAQETVKNFSCAEVVIKFTVPILIVSLYLVTVSFYGRFVPFRIAVNSLSKRTVLGLVGVIIFAGLSPNVMNEQSIPRPGNLSAINEVSGQEAKDLKLVLLGQVDHGKTTLASAIAKISSELGKANYVAYDQIDNAPEEKIGGVTFAMKKVSFNTWRRGYSMFDFPGHADIVKSLILGAVGGSGVPDGAILVVSAADGPMPSTREQVNLARQIGIQRIVVYISKVDMVDDKKQISLVEAEVRELLSEYDFNKTGTPFIFGSALLTLQGDISDIGIPSIIWLLDALDQYIQPVEPPFLMKIVDINSFVQPEVTGHVIRGSAKVGDIVEIVGKGSTIRAKVGKIELLKKKTNGDKGDRETKLSLTDIDNNGLKLIERSSVISTPGTIKYHKEFKAETIFLDKEEGGIHTPIFKGNSKYFNFWTEGGYGNITLPDDAEMLMAGDNMLIKINLSNTAAIGKGMRFSIQENKCSPVIGYGIITEVND